jgi:hypothetical protein
MKRMPRTDLFSWSAFQTHLDIDFHSYAWIRPGGNVVIDPLPLSEHDIKHLQTLGGVQHVIVTNSGHARAARELAAQFEAELLGPAAEREAFPLPCARWLGDDDQPFPGMRVLSLQGSKTPGEVALLLEGKTLIVGDLVRSHRAGELSILKPEQGLKDRAAAVDSVARLAALRPDVLLVGDGFSVYRDAGARLAELHERLKAGAA